MGSHGGGAGARAGGGAVELERTVPFSELESKVKIDDRIRDQIRGGWALMDDPARREVLESGITNLTRQRFRKGARTKQLGGATFSGEIVLIGRRRFPRNMEPTGEVRIRPTAGGMTAVRTASTLVHEAGHVGGKYSGTVKNFARRGDPTEGTSTDRQIRFLGRLYQESIRTGNTGRGMEALFAANNAFNYRVESAGATRGYGFKGSRYSLEDRTGMFGDKKAAMAVGLSRLSLKRGAEKAAKQLGI